MFGRSSMILARIGGVSMSLVQKKLEDGRGETSIPSPPHLSKWDGWVQKLGGVMGIHTS